jgi:hypothetical protein
MALAPTNNIAFAGGLTDTGVDATLQHYVKTSLRWLHKVETQFIYQNIQS